MCQGRVHQVSFADRDRAPTFHSYCHIPEFLVIQWQQKRQFHPLPHPIVIVWLIFSSLYRNSEQLIVHSGTMEFGAVVEQEKHQEITDRQSSRRNVSK
ncbi:hypothetical protein J6590_098505 [Homalodisca vitripennis]|nr:hypothetical protein J6590_098505 [Homalodisca vitripennis]